MIKDHLGNQYTSEAKMCRAWNISYVTYRNRRYILKWNLKEVLENNINNNRTEIEDHLGRKYSSEKELCRAWNIPVNTFRYRFYKAGWSLEDALTKSPSDKFKHRNKFKDHLGNEYDTQIDMSEAWGIPYEVYRDRKYKLKWDIKHILTTPVISKEIRDHLGKVYSNTQEMCNAWGIPYETFRNRLRVSGWSLEEALTTPINGRRNK